MAVIVVVDSGPLGLLTNPKANPDIDACRAWLDDLRGHGGRVLVPEIIDYELRRELIRAGKSAGIRLLDAFIEKFEYVPITTEAMRLAAKLWAEIRQAGKQTASDTSLDGDVILAAQVLSLSLPAGSFIVATTNVAHIGRFVPAGRWQEITIGEG